MAKKSEEMNPASHTKEEKSKALEAARLQIEKQ